MLTNLEQTVTAQQIPVVYRDRRQVTQEGPTQHHGQNMITFVGQVSCMLALLCEVSRSPASTARKPHSPSPVTSDTKV